MKGGEEQWPLDVDLFEEGGEDSPAAGVVDEEEEGVVSGSGSECKKKV